MNQKIGISRMLMSRVAVTVFFIRMRMYNYATVDNVGMIEKTDAYKECKKKCKKQTSGYYIVSFLQSTDLNLIVLNQ